MQGRLLGTFLNDLLPPFGDANFGFFSHIIGGFSLEAPSSRATHRG